MNNKVTCWGDETVVIDGYVQRDTPLNLISEIKLPIVFPVDPVDGQNVVITREAIKHISESGQYKKLPKLTMKYMPKSIIMKDDIIYIRELEIIGFGLEDEI